MTFSSPSARVGQLRSLQRGEPGAGDRDSGQREQGRHGVGRDVGAPELVGEADRTRGEPEKPRDHQPGSLRAGRGERADRFVAARVPGHHPATEPRGQPESTRAGERPRDGSGSHRRVATSSRPRSGIVEPAGDRVGGALELRRRTQRRTAPARRAATRDRPGARRDRPTRCSRRTPSRYGTAIGSCRRWTRNARIHNGSRRFQLKRVSTYSRDQITLPSSASSTSGSEVVAAPTTSAQPETDEVSGTVATRRFRRSSGRTRASGARGAGARRWGRARDGSTGRRSADRPHGCRPCARRGSALPRGGPARRRPIPCTPGREVQRWSPGPG